MSATVNAEIFRDFFETNFKSRDDASKNTATIMSIQGRCHPVELFFLKEACRNYITSAVDTCIKIHKSEEQGDILVFLPGSEEIDSAIEELERIYPSDDMYALALHSSLPYSAQILAFEPSQVVHQCIFTLRQILTINIVNV